MLTNLTFSVHWNDLLPYRNIFRERIPKGSTVYVIVVENDAGLGLARIRGNQRLKTAHGELQNS